MVFRFVHTADLHLDSPLRTLALRDPELGALIQNATRQAFEGLVESCLEEAVDALLIAGDLYDGDLRSIGTALFFSRQMRRLGEAGIRVFLIRGNHDAESVLTRQLSLPENVHVFGARAGVEILEDPGVAIHGISFRSGRIPESLVPKFRAPEPGRVNIGLLHTSLAGGEGHDEYAPCSLAELRGHGFDYWALGHVHRRTVHATAPHVVMPGIPQGRDIGEAGPKSATLVTVGDDGAIDTDEIPTALAEFRRVPVDAGGIETPAALPPRLERALAAARDDLAAPTLVARLEITGATAISSWLRRDAELVLGEARQAAEAVGGTLVEKVEVRCTPPRQGMGAPAADPVLELREIMADTDDLPEILKSEARRIVETLRGQLPPELRNRFGGTDEEIEALAARLIREGGDEVLARLESGEQD